MLFNLLNIQDKQDYVERLKKASFGKRVQNLDSLELLCISLAEGYFRQMEVLHFPQVYETITAADIERWIQSALAPEKSALSIIYPIGWKGERK